MSIDSGTFILSLFDWIQVSKYYFKILLVLIKQRPFDSLSNFIHFLQTHFLLLFIKPVIIQIFNQFTTIFNIQINFFIVLLSFICYWNFVWNADAFEIFDEITKIDASGNKVSLWIKTPQILCLWIDVNPCKRYWASVSFEDQSIGIIPKSDAAFIVMDDNLLGAYCKETLNSGSLINIDVSN